jgi:glycerophosphoryl diester phosphodiesterase
MRGRWLGPKSTHGIEVFTDENITRLRDEHPDLHIWAFPSGGYGEETAENYQDLLDRGVDGIITARPTEFPG